MKKIFLILFFVNFFGFSGEKEMIAYMQKINNRLSETEAEEIYRNVVRYSTEYEFDPILVFSVMKTESNFRHSTKSSAGAQGLMQLMPVNFEEFKVDNSVKGNIKGGIKHLKRDYDNTKDLTKTLVCYNAGCGRLQNGEWKKIKETRNYVERVNRIYSEIHSEYYSNTEPPFFKTLKDNMIVPENFLLVYDTKNEGFPKELYRSEFYK